MLLLELDVLSVVAEVEDVEDDEELDEDVVVSSAAGV